MRRRTLLASLLAATALPGRADAAEDRLRFLRIATGIAAGTAFPVGMTIANAVSSPPGSRSCDRGGPCGVPNLVAVAQTSEGSVANLSAIAADQMDSGIALSDIVWGAVNGQGIYFRRGRAPNLRIIANLYQESVHLVARRGARIQRIVDLVGKRVSLDRPGSGTRVNAELILSSFGVRPTQFTVVEADPAEAFGRFAAGELDALFATGGYPLAAVSDLVEQGTAELVPIAGRPAEQAIRRHRFFSRDVIPAGTYRDVGAIETLSLGAQWVIAESFEEKFVYALTQSLWHPRNRVTLDSGHAKGKLIQLSTALDGVSTPLHPGAERYYREKGLLNDRSPEERPPPATQ
jgi:TRAP transporter TAXI family solute receptor